MAAMNTPKIVLPVKVAQDILRKAQNNSTIQALSPSTPALFKNVEVEWWDVFGPPFRLDDVRQVAEHLVRRVAVLAGVQDLLALGDDP